MLQCDAQSCCCSTTSRSSSSSTRGSPGCLGSTLRPGRLRSDMMIFHTFCQHYFVCLFYVVVIVEKAKQCARYGSNTILHRPVIISALWQYIKTHKLQDQHEKEFVNCDPFLKQIFQVDKSNISGFSSSSETPFSSAPISINPLINMSQQVNLQLLRWTEWNFTQQVKLYLFRRTG